jgi:hypothetical protein
MNRRGLPLRIWPPETMYLKRGRKWRRLYDD